MEIKIISKKHGEKIVLIDKKDFDKFKKYTWVVSFRCNKFYCIAAVRINNKRTTIRLHRYLMNCPRGMEIDHKNGDSLDNRRKNLRICTRAENSMNMAKSSHKMSSKYKGVHFYKRYKNYQVSIKFKQKKIHLGYFDNEIEAAKAYNKKAKELFGKFARLNII